MTLGLASKGFASWWQRLYFFSQYY